MKFDGDALKKWLDEQIVDAQTRLLSTLSGLLVVRKKIERMECTTFADLEIGEFFLWGNRGGATKPRQKIDKDHVFVVPSTDRVPVIFAHIPVKRLKISFEGVE